MGIKSGWITTIPSPLYRWLRRSLREPACKYSTSNRFSRIVLEKALKKVLLRQRRLSTFKKAFDSVNHQLLRKKLPWYGIKNRELRWFENNLTSWCQSVVYGSAQSASQRIKYGLLQGSILHPILFSIYINDLPNCLLQSKILLYADDTVLFYANSNIGNIDTVLFKDLKQLQSWTYLNKVAILR